MHVQLQFMSQQQTYDNNNSDNNDSYPCVELIQQEAISVESSPSTGGNQREVHVVIKNQPFNMKLRAVSNGASSVNFHNTTIQAKLFYDYDPPKAVDFIRDEPLQYVGTVNSSGDEVSVEVKLAILSSQHQNSLFLVMLRILDTTTSGSSCVLSHPIRIVSKIDHIRKEGVPIKKKTFNEILTDRLHELELVQEEQTQVIRSILEKKHVPFEVVKCEPDDASMKKRKRVMELEPKDIQTCFNNVVNTFKGTEEDKRPPKIRKAIKGLHMDELAQVLDAFGSDLRDFKPTTIKEERDCMCVDCPARKEIENYNSFYNNFLALSTELIRSPKFSSCNQQAQEFVNQLMLSAPFFSAQSPSLSLSSSLSPQMSMLSQIVPQMVRQAQQETITQQSCELPTQLSFCGPLETLAEMVLN